jgi:predicted LPLAT superfamily acyltransferase
MTAAVPEWQQRSERGSPWLLGWMARTSLRLGRPVSRVILYVVGAYYFVFAPAARRAMLNYLRRVLGRRARARDRMRLIMNFATIIHDRLYILAGRDELFDITLQGEDVVRAATRGGGALLMGAHVGNFEVLRLIGQRKSGLDVTVAMYEDNARKLNALLQAVRAQQPLEIVAVGRLDSMLRLHECLERGRLVGVLADRLFGAEPSLPVAFMGASAHFPINPMRLAALLRCRVIFMLGLFRGGNHYHVVFEPLADFSTVQPAQRAAAIEAGVHRYASLLEQHCRADPYNWFNFFDFWADRGGAATPPRALRSL